MRFHKQRFQHDPDNGIYGDCQRTAIACLMDLELDEVPHFLDGNPDGIEFTKRLNHFVDSRGQRIFTVPYLGNLDEVLASIGNFNPDAIYMLSGESARGLNHVVICQGGEIIHDPHPSSSGLIGPCKPDGFYWVEILVPKQEAL